MGKFFCGGIVLVVNVGLLVLLIVYNVGQYWFKVGWVKYLGIIQVVIGLVMYVEGEGLCVIVELNQCVEVWVSEIMVEISFIQQWVSYLELLVVL